MPEATWWDELRRLERQQLAQVTEATRLQGEADEICSRVERLEKDMGNVATKNDLQYSRDLITAQISLIKESVDPMRKGIYALVWLVLAAVVGGGLAFLIKSPGP